MAGATFHLASASVMPLTMAPAACGDVVQILALGMAFAHVTLSASVAKDGPGQAVSNAHVVERVNMDAMDMASASLWLVAVITPLCNAIVTKIGKVFIAPTTSAKIVAVGMVHAGTGTATASQVTQVKTAVKVIARVQAL